MDLADLHMQIRGCPAQAASPWHTFSQPLCFVCILYFHATQISEKWKDGAASEQERETALASQGASVSPEAFIKQKML